MINLEVQEINFTNNYQKAVSFNIICPVNLYKTQRRKQILTSKIWSDTKAILQTRLTPWKPDDKTAVYRFNFFVPKTDKKDIDAGLKFAMDLLQGYYYYNDRQVKQVNINLHKDKYYYILLELITLADLKYI